MADYREQPVDGKTWRRCRRLDIINDSDSQFVLFHEEDVAQVGGQVFKTPLSYLRKDFNPTGEIPLVNPLTGELTGQVVTEQELYVMLYSAYIKTAKERDDYEIAQQSGG